MMSAEQRLKELGIALPAPPELFGAYAEAVQTGNPLFLTGMLPTEGRAGKVVSGDVRDQPRIADATSELLRDLFGEDKQPSPACRSAFQSNWKSLSR